MMKKVFSILLAGALLLSCGEKEPENIPGRPGSGTENNGGSGNNGGSSQPGTIKDVAPTVELGAADEDISLLKLKPGKLISITQVTESVGKRAVDAGMCVDVILGDEVVVGMTDEALETMFKNAEAAVKATGVEIWGMHLPYKDDAKIQYADEAKRQKSVALQNKLIKLSMKYLKPRHFVTHPGSGNYYTHEAERFPTAKKQVQKSLVEMQTVLDEQNRTYGLNSIICVENCTRTVGYDAESLLELLSAPGLEKVRICLDTGHAIMPMNGEYRDRETGLATKDGDVVGMLKRIGTRLGTLHIQQNHGAEGKKNPTDEHILPWNGGLIDWGEFYEVLLKDCRYRGCFLYEVSYEKEYKGTSATIESSKTNYEEVIYPLFVSYLKK